MKRIMIACVAVAAFAAPALAAQPDGILWPFKTGNGPTVDGKQVYNTVAQGSAQVIQDGQFASGNCNCGIDQTTYAGSEADLVQGALSQPGQPHNK